MKKTKLFSILLVLTGLALILSAGFTAFAATTANQNVTFSNPISSSITLTGAAADFGAATPGSAQEVTGAATIDGTANAVWTVTLTGTDFINGTNTILKSDCFKVKGGAVAAYSSIGAGIAVISGHAIGAGSATMDYQLNVPVSAPGAAGSYSGTLTYTISTT